MTIRQSTETILIAGGGIGGLSAALGLAKVGVASTVLERAPEIKEIGAGIQLGPNAFLALDYLGVGEQVRRIAVHIGALRMMDAVTAEEIAFLPLDDAFFGRFKNPYAVIHRGEMHTALLRACETSPLVSLRTNCEVVSYQQTDKRVVVKNTAGEAIEGRALIGADGLSSNVRKSIVGDSPRVSGHTTFRSAIPTEHMPEELRWNAMTIWVGPKSHLVTYPLSDWKLFNLVVTSHNEAPEAVFGKSVSVEEVHKGFTHLHEEALKIIDSGLEWKLWVLCDRDSVTNWRDGRVVLLGDAAHPMMQYLAQGACMAIEDAVQLSLEIQRYDGDIETAFEAYQQARFERTARAQLDARRMGDNVFHVDGQAARERNNIMRAMGREDFFARMQWLYEGIELC